MKRILIAALLCLLGAFVCAWSFVLVLQATLPPTDAAYGQGLAVLRDPFVWIVLSPVALLGGGVTFILWLWLLRDRSPVWSAGVVLGTVLIGTVVGTMLASSYGRGVLGLGAVPLALALGLAVSRRVLPVVKP